VAATAIEMVARKTILRTFRNLEAIRKVHIAISSFAGIFLLLHVAYFATYPLDSGVLLGYAAAASILVVWLTGTAFLERFRDSLFFHGTLTTAAVALIVLHSSVSGINLPFAFDEVVTALVASTTLILGARQAWRMLPGR